MKNVKSILILLAIAPMNFCFGQLDAINVEVSKNTVVVESIPRVQIQQNKSKQHINKLDRKKRREGNWEFYWDDANPSTVSSKGKFRNGKQVGTWTYYSEAGKLERIEKNKWLSKKIVTEQYYPNGKLEKCGIAKIVVDKEYINYFWVGEWKCYDEGGNFVKTEVYKNGELVEEK